MSNTMEQIEKALRPMLETEARRISEEFPLVKTRVVSFVGNSNGRYVLGLECLLTAAAQHEADLVALCINIENFDAAPIVFMDISWGDPSGYIEAEQFERPLALSDTTLETIKTDLPDFFQILRSIIEQGKPSCQVTDCSS